MGKNTIMTELSDRIKQVRGSISREKFAALIEISARSLVAYEQAENVPKADVLERICAKTCTSPRWLLLGVGPIYEQDTPPSSEGPDSENVQQLDMGKKQHHEIIELEKNKTSDSRTFSESAALQQENAALNKELRDLMRENSTILRENGDLRVDVERKKARITELERELARVLKSEEAAPVAEVG